MVVLYITPFTADFEAPEIRFSVGKHTAKQRQIYKIVYTPVNSVDNSVHTSQQCGSDYKGVLTVYKQVYSSNNLEKLFFSSKLLSALMGEIQQGSKRTISN